MSHKDIKTKKNNTYGNEKNSIYSIRESSEYDSLEVPIRPSETTKNVDDISESSTK